MKIDKKLTTMAFAAAFITSAASAQYVDSNGDTIAGEITGGDNTTNTLVEDINAALANAEANATAYADGLAVNYDAAGSAAAEANANTYTDGREAAITTAYLAYADTAEADAVTAANKPLPLAAYAAKKANSYQ